MNYILGEFMPHDYNYKFVFDDGRWIGLDLARDYLNYRVPFSDIGSNEWHFTAIESKRDEDIGSIKLFNYDELRKINTNIRLYRENGILYRKSTQTELDKYMYKTQPQSANGRVYKLLEMLYTKDKNKTITIII